MHNVCRNRARTEDFDFTCRVDECSGSRLCYLAFWGDLRPTSSTLEEIAAIRAFPDLRLRVAHTRGTEHDKDANDSAYRKEEQQRNPQKE
jgi:hypothetical protein